MAMARVSSITTLSPALIVSKPGTLGAIANLPQCSVWSVKSDNAPDVVNIGNRGCHLHRVEFGLTLRGGFDPCLLGHDRVQRTTKNSPGSSEKPGLFA